jgi:hypothetical protein
MKRASLTLALTILFCSSAVLVAADRPAEKTKGKPVKVEKAKKSTKAAAGHEQIALTGSYIKRDVHRNGVVTDGPNPVYVLDSEAIRNSGAADLRELLVFRGLNR